MARETLPPELIRFVRNALPDYPSAVLLVLLARETGRSWDEDSILLRMGPSFATAEAVQRYVGLFVARGLVLQDPDGRIRYAPATEDLRQTVEALAQAYERHPVTLIRTIYEVSSGAIESFADAFRWKREEDQP